MTKAPSAAVPLFPLCLFLLARARADHTLGPCAWATWLQESELFEACYDGPGIDKQPIPADVLSR